MSGRYRLPEPVSGLDELIAGEAEFSFQRSGETCRQVMEWLAPKAGESLLDLSCGLGGILRSAGSWDVQATGLEFSPEAAAISQKSAPEATVVLGDLAELPFEIATFDLLTCLGAPDFFCEPDRSLREVGRVLKPGGRACLLLPNSQEIQYDSLSENFPNDGRGRFPSRAGWTRILTLAGFRIWRCLPDYRLDVHASLAGLNPWLRACKIASWRLLHWVPSPWVQAWGFFIKKLRTARFLFPGEQS